MGNEAWSKIQLHGNLELKNLMALYTLTLRTNLEHFLESIVYILYIVSKLRKSAVQLFKRYANRSWNKEVMAIWRQLRKVEGPFQNSTYEVEIQFEMTPILNSPTATFMFHLLYLGNCIYSTYEFKIHFEMTPISNSPNVTLMFRLLYLENCI